MQLLLPLCSLANHSCVPTIRYEPTWIVGRGGCLLPGVRYVAVRPIGGGEELTHPYVDPAAAWQDRHARLAPYGFACACAKCTDEGVGGRQANE